MKCVAVIRKNETGEIRRYETEEEIECCDFFNDYNWREGNFSCDCNRELFFERAAGVEAKDEECSEGKFSVNIVNAETGRIYYKEFDL